MPEITFGESAIVHMLDVFGLDEDDEGRLIDSDKNVVKDAFGYEVEVSEVGGFVHLDGFYEVNDEGRVECLGNPVTEQFDTMDESRPEALVPVGEDTAVLRDSFPHITDYAECENMREDEN